MTDSVMTQFTQDLAGGSASAPITKKPAQPIASESSGTIDAAPTQPTYAKFRRRTVAGATTGTVEPADIIDPSLPKAKGVKKIDPQLVRLGLKRARLALLYGTALALGGAAAGTAATCYYLDVWTFRDFTRKMKSIVPHMVSKVEPSVSSFKQTSGGVRVDYCDLLMLCDDVSL